MEDMQPRLTFLLLAAIGLCLLAGARKPPAPAIRLHVETHAADGEIFSLPVRVGNPPRQLHVERMPMITEREVAAIYPFQARDGSGTFGIYLQLDNHGSKAVQQITTEKRHALIVPIINGRPVSVLRMDRPVRDGIISIPGGITGEELFALGQAHPIIGESREATRSRQAQQLREYQERMRDRQPR